jgi:hypothetical protein
MNKLLAIALVTPALFAQEIIGPIRIHAGSAPYTDVSSQVWASDAAYVQGVTAISTSPLAPVANATNIGLYRAQRISFPMGASCSNFSYVVPVPNNRYRITLKLAELGPTARTVVVTLNGTVAALNIATQPGSATDRVYYANVANSLLTIALSSNSTAACPVISALEILPQIPIAETDVTSLNQDFSTVVRRGPGYGTGAVAFVNGAGQLETVAGDPGACVLTDGTTQGCGYADGETPQGTLDGTNATFTLAGSPAPPSSLVLTRNGLVLALGPDYTIADSTITFVSAAVPQTGDILIAFYRQ